MHTRTPQLQQELLSARREIESQATQILALEASLLARPELPPDAPENEKDRLLGEQARNIRELEMVVKGYEDNLGAPLRAVREDVEREWSGRLAAEEGKRKEAEEWATELARALEKEKKVCAKPRSTSQAQADDDDGDRHGSSWKTNVVPSRRS
jgi:centromeric protein E